MPMLAYSFLVAATLFLLSEQAYTFSTSLKRIKAEQGVVLLDGLAFSTTTTQKALVELQSFTYKEPIDVAPFNASLTQLLASVGVSLTEQQSAVALDRLKLFAAIPGSDNVPVIARFCPLNLDNPVNGTVNRNFTLCGQTLRDLAGKDFSATLPATGDRKINATVFVPATSDGFGVISDIDDTIKVTNVLNQLKALQAILLLPATPVTGMPELYSSIASSLKPDPFVYLSGSPYQFYPFLRPFIQSTFPPGPLFLQNATLTNFDLKPVLTQTLESLFDYKSEMIDRLRGMYPRKKFIAFGDSTQRDPETYAAAYRRYGDFIRCIYIRAVDGANNTDERFAAAFGGVPAGKFRVFNDSSIADLQNIDIASGYC